MLEISEEVGFILYIIEGSAIVLINLAVICVIFCPHLLRDRKALVLLGGLCISDTVNALAYLMAGIYRLLVLKSGEGYVNVSRYDCFVQPHNIMFYIGYQLTSIMTMVVSFDRVVAVFFPVKHIWFTIGRFNTYFVLLGALLVCTVSFGVAFFVQSNDHQVFINIYCYFIFTLQPDVWDFVLLFRVVTIGLSVLVYLPICWRVRILIKKNNQPKKLIKITTTIGLSAMSGLLCLVIPDLLMYIDHDNLAQYHKYFYFIGLNKSLINAFIYMLRHREIRKGFLLAASKPFGWKVSSGSLAYVDHISVIHPPMHSHAGTHSG
ncbi:hypothetical protein QR680_018185 [Steinernema hermaphroditum]|uniref:G-protein coupled receptors family 1 profile domain-containing protein n=1 Tax=Steinernema hermaphroditum TaxID=289476 RepID=A0AA39HHW9_9BILA|nr:hypothetical protein QR680_018185 [Steinernema hermaphroditum]